MIRRNSLWGVVGIFLTISVFCSGCYLIDSAVNKEYKKDSTKWNAESYGAIRAQQQKRSLDYRTLQKMDFIDTFSIGEIGVCYQQGLETQANCVGEQLYLLLPLVEDRIGFEISLRFRVYLTWVDELPETFEYRFLYKDNVIDLPLFVEVDDESCSSILTQSFLYPAALVHELVEFSLLFPMQGPIVMQDISWKWFCFSGISRNYTRWFRDGFATYAAYIALETIASSGVLLGGEDWRPYKRRIFERPLSALSKIGKELFSWHQYSDQDYDLTLDYYNAASGLFLFIRHEFGEKAIREVIGRFDEVEYLDGEALITLFNETLNIDLVKIAEDFEFPVFGFESKPLTPALALNWGLEVTHGLRITDVNEGSLAEQAGMQKDDVIVKINDEPIKSNLDFELSILGSMRKGVAEIIILRNGLKQQFSLRLS